MDDGKEDEAQVSLAVRDAGRVQGGAQKQSRNDGGHHGNLKREVLSAIADNYVRPSTFNIVQMWRITGAEDPKTEGQPAVCSGYVFERGTAETVHAAAHLAGPEDVNEAVPSHQSPVTAHAGFESLGARQRKPAQRKLPPQNFVLAPASRKSVHDHHMC